MQADLFQAVGILRATRERAGCSGEGMVLKRVPGGPGMGMGDKRGEGRLPGFTCQPSPRGGLAQVWEGIEKAAVWAGINQFLRGGGIEAGKLFLRAP